MQIEKITVSVNKKINLGNFETKDYAISAEASLESGETLKVAATGVKQVIENVINEWEANLKGINIPQFESAEINKTIPNQNYNILPVTESFICPKCNEVMKKKEGKEYYLCSKHFGYPDMIRKGDVRDRTFYKNNRKPNSSMTV